MVGEVEEFWSINGRKRQQNQKMFYNVLKTFENKINSKLVYDQEVNRKNKSWSTWNLYARNI